MARETYIFLIFPYFRLLKNHQFAEIYLIVPSQFLKDFWQEPELLHSLIVPNNKVIN